MCLSKERFESKMIPRFLADSTGANDELSGSVKFGLCSFRELGRKTDDE